MTSARQAPDLVRLHVPDDLAAEGVLGLGAGQSHYLRNVMRLQAGAELALFNGRDGEWRARIDGIGKGWCSLVVQDRLRPQTADSDVWLVFAPVKRARLDFIAQHATELGVAALWPVFTRHTSISRVNVDRLRANAIEAAEQSDRLTVPQVFAPAPLDRVMADWPSERRVFLCDESGTARPAAELFADGAGPPAAVLCGPEGGFAPSELDGLRKLPFVTPIALGPRVLRAETAAIAALACWQALAGDWRRPA